MHSDMVMQKQNSGSDLPKEVLPLRSSTFRPQLPYLADAGRGTAKRYIDSRAFNTQPVPQCFLECKSNTEFVFSMCMTDLANPAIVLYIQTIL